MPRVVLTGPLARSSLLHILLGEAPGTGSVASCDDAAFDRLSFFADVIGLEAQVHQVDAQAATMFVPVQAEHSLWQAETVPIVDAAAREIMGYYGRIPVAALIPRRQMILSRAAAWHAAQTGAAPAKLRGHTGADTVEVWDRTAPHEGFFLTRTYRLRHPRFDGTMSAEMQREVFVATDAALVLPYDPVRDRVLLVEQFRMGPFGRGDSYPWVLEPVAGRVDAGETPEDTARRECLEEADLVLGTLKHMSSHYCSPGCSTEFFHCYLGLCDLLEVAPSIGGLETEHEDIRRHVIDFEDAQALMQTGEVNIGPLYLMLLWLERERPRLRSVA